MKKKITILIVAIVTTLAAEAKSNVEALFSGPYRNKQDASQIVIKGEQLAPYMLDEFMSLTVSNPEDRDALNSAVEADAKTAITKEVTYSGGKIAYCFLTLKKEPGTNRYVFFYQDSGKAVVMYMEGDASASKIKNMIKKTDKKTKK